MCGYIGGRKKLLTGSNMLRNLLRTQEHRGKDGFGYIAMYPEGNYKAAKSMSSKNIIKEITKLKGDPFVMFHHRATSVGGTKAALAHPLKTNNTLLMQNGTNKDPYYLVNNAESDSEALSKLCDIMKPEDFYKYILNDMGVVFYIKNGKAYLYRDDERPLCLHESGIIASEPIMEGTWHSIDIGHNQVTYDGKELKGFELFNSTVIEDIGEVKKCSYCGKRHYTDTEGTICNACLADGVAQKKDYRWNRNDDYVDYYEYTDDRYTDFFTRDVSSTYTIGYKVFGDTGDGEPRKMHGIPVQLDNEIWLVRAEEDAANAADYLVEAVYIDDKLSDTIKGTPVPAYTSMKYIMEQELWAYWSDTDKVYDLQKDVFYLEAEYLDKTDRNALMFNPATNSYAVPFDYNWVP